jgi:hypothetical protein
MRKRLAQLSVAFAVVLILGSCGSPNGPAEGALFELNACRGSVGSPPEGEAFRVEVTTPSAVADFQGLVGKGNIKVITGAIAPGDGGFNSPWSWHLIPATVEAVDLAIEVCDGCPSYVEGHLDDYLSLGQYCPWGAEVVRRIR